MKGEFLSHASDCCASASCIRMGFFHILWFPPTSCWKLDWRWVSVHIVFPPHRTLTFANSQPYLLFCQQFMFSNVLNMEPLGGNEHCYHRNDHKGNPVMIFRDLYYKPMLDFFLEQLNPECRSFHVCSHAVCITSVYIIRAVFDLLVQHHKNDAPNWRNPPAKRSV